MKHKAKIRRREGSQPDISKTDVEVSSLPAMPGRSSIERVDEHNTGSVETVPQTVPENGVAGFMEPERSDAQGAR